MMFSFVILAFTGLAIAGIAAMVVGGGVSIYSGFQANSAAKESAKMQTDAARMAANAQQMAANAQADQIRDRASLAAIQAGVEDKKAAVAQQQGELETRRRMVQLSYDIGNTYSQWAGNGLLVDGGDDSLGHLLTANTREAGQDVGIIKTNAENAVWEHGMNKTSALMSQKSLLAQADSTTLIGQANSGATIMAGEAQAYATRQAGLTALYQGWGTGLQMFGGAAVAGAGAFGSAGSAGGGIGSWGEGGSANAANSGGWAGTNSVQTVRSATPMFGIA